MLITEEYRDLNAQLHKSRSDYGKRGSLIAPLAWEWCMNIGTTDVLDYGCGKAELNLHMPFAVKCYDPAVEKYSEKPEPADLVVCTDVLEHVEPECIDAVLDDLQRVTRRNALMTIALKPAIKTLADGRNAHVLLRPAEWWDEQISRRFDIVSSEKSEGGVAYVLRAKKEAS